MTSPQKPSRIRRAGWLPTALAALCLPAAFLTSCDKDLGNEIENVGDEIGDKIENVGDELGG